MANEFSDQKIIPAEAEEFCLISRRETETLMQSEALPRGAIIRAFDRNAKSDWVSKIWVCFLLFPFTIGMKFPFPDLVNRFFEVTGLSYAQTQPMIWRILHSLCLLNEKENLDIGLPEIAACYQLGTHGYKRFTLKTRNKERRMIPRSSHNDGDWNRKFFFVKRDSIPGGKDLPLTWVKNGSYFKFLKNLLVRKLFNVNLISLTALKFEDLVTPAPLNSPKLVRLFQIENREKISTTANSPSQASTSSSTPVMSSATPKLSAKFSLADLKTTMVKKEKSSETPASKPAHVPVTRLKRKKVLENPVDLDAFDELSPEETKNKINLGVNHLFQMVQHNADEVLKANDKIADLQKIALKKDGWYRQQENELRKELENAKAELAEAKAQAERELEEVKAEALAEKNVLIQEAQESAAATVYEAMFNMAKEAAAAGCLLSSWDVAAWAEALGKPASEVPVLKKAVDEGAGEMAVDVGDEGGINA